MMRRLMRWIVGFGLLLSGSNLTVQAGEKVRVEGTGKALGQTPIIVEYHGKLIPSAEHPVALKLDGRTIPADLFFDVDNKPDDKGSGRYLGFILDHLPATGHLELDLSIDDQFDPSLPHARIGAKRVGDAGTEIRYDGLAWTNFVPNVGPKPYFFPLVGPNGDAMTRSFPMVKVEGETIDHPHHRSLWFAHGSVNKVDFWSEAPGHGTIRSRLINLGAQGAALGTLRTAHDWIGPDGKKICVSEQLVRFWHAKDVRMMDFDVTISAPFGPVTLGDTKEGMFGLRVPSSMDVTAKQGGKIVNAEGITDAKAWGKPSPWVDYSGPVAGKTVGISILNHPESFRYPTTWHVRDYGLFAANPFGGKDFKTPGYGEFMLPAGESIRFRYRIILHDGDAASANIPAEFESYRASPKVTIP